MLRLLVLVLLLANLLLAAWNLGWLGAAPGSAEREPQRMKQQVNPQAVTLLAPQAASQVLAQAAAAARAASAAALAASDAGADASRCYETGPLAATEVGAAERALREVTPALPRWSTHTSEHGGSFLVYMGKYAEAAALAKKRDELKRLGVAFEELRNAPNLQPGLELGRFDDRAQAEALLARITGRGVKTARVVTLTPPVTVTQLRFEPVADEAQRERLLALQLPGGAVFKPCQNPGAKP